MASPTQWAWVWVNSGSWWWTGRPGVLQSMGSQRVGPDWATELNWTDIRISGYFSAYLTSQKASSGIIYSKVFKGKKIKAKNNTLSKIILQKWKRNKDSQILKSWVNSMSLDLRVVLVAQSCPTLCHPIDCSLQGSSVHVFLLGEFHSPGDFPDLGIEPRSWTQSPTFQADSQLSEPQRSPPLDLLYNKCYREFFEVKENDARNELEVLWEYKVLW